MNKVKFKNLSEGDIIEIDKNFWKILELKHSHLGRGGANIQAKLKNIVNDSNVIKNFNPDDEINLIDVIEGPIKFIYKKNNLYYFLDENNKKYQLDSNNLGFKINFLKKDLDLLGLFIEDKLINIILPIKAKYLVVEAPPGIKGDSQKSPNKIITIETGYQLSVPLFIEKGDYIIINTETGEYIERFK
ncbi:MAG: elongation factor P [Candidatus Parcubacteria bacterium]|nr:MAG: elongation factor P [Candidatus Parcubacteria bacterium]